MANRRLHTIAIGCLLAFLVASATWASGYYYEAVTTTQTAEKKNSRSDMKVRAWVDGLMAKVEFVSGEKKGFFSAGSYLVTKDGGQTVHLVNPQDKTFAEFDLEQLIGAGGEAMNMLNQTGGMMKLEFTDVTAKKILEEPSQPILGRSTTHYRWNSGYTMKLAVIGIKQENRLDMVQDFWCTSDLEAKGFGVWLKPDRFKTGNTELDELIQGQFTTIRGFPLKTVVTTTTTSKKGKTATTTSTTEVTTLREETPASTLFDVPPDPSYTEKQIVPQMPAGLESQGR